MVARDAAAASAGRADLSTALRRDQPEHVRRQRPRSRARHGYECASSCPIPTASSGRRRRWCGAHAARAEAVCRRARVPRLSAGHAAEDRAGFRRPDVRVQPHVLGHRLGDGRASAGAAGRHDPGARRPTSTTAANTRTCGGQHVPFDGTYYLTATERPRSRSPSRRRRRRSDLRRQRHVQSLQREGRELQLLRGADDSEHGNRDLGGHAVHRRLQGPDGEEDCRFENIGMGVYTNYSAPATSTSRTTGSSAATIRSRDQLVDATSGRRSRRRAGRCSRR